MKKLDNLVTFLLDQEGDGKPLDLRDLKIIAYVAVNGGEVSMQDIVKDTKIPRNTVSSKVFKMVKDYKGTKGFDLLVSREDPNSLVAKKVSLTEKGKEFLKSLEGIMK